ncbi:MAG: response regulator transcription factor [Pseudomonadota bacterium]
MISVLIADDHGVLRAGLKALLESHDDINVSADVGDGNEVMPALVANRPDILLLDLTMPNLEPLEMIRTVTREASTTKTLILSVHEDAALVKRTLEAGAKGYINKRAVESELIYAIRTVYKNDTYVHPSLMASFLDVPSEPDRAIVNTKGQTPLTTREVEVMNLTARGFTSKQTAEQLGLSKRTVDVHRANIKRKLNLESRADWVSYNEQHFEQ